MIVAEYPNCSISLMEESDISELAENLRNQDVIEISGLGATNEFACQQSYFNSHKKFTVRLNNNKLVACFGVGSVTDDIGMIWMLGTKYIKDIKNTLLRHGRDWVTHLMIGYDFVYNVVHTQNTVSIKWLKWLGAKFLDNPAPEGYQYFRLGGDA